MFDYQNFFLFILFFFCKNFLWQNTIYRTEKKNPISFLFNKYCQRCPEKGATTIVRHKSSHIQPNDPSADILEVAGV